MIGLQPNELIIDSFAGGGGASTGLEWALGRSPDVAINHDPEAVALHAANHPATLHLCQSVWKADPRDVVMQASLARGSKQPLPVGVAWFSPDCVHFSKAKGSKPVKKHVRDLAWVVVHWAKLVKPRIILLENVEEFKDWGPLIQTEDGRFVPCPLSKGLTFKRWVRELRRFGYVVEWRELRACDYGAPTIRKRLFVVARRDGLPISWPAPTHAKDGAGGLLPWRAAAEIIDWTLPCPSIFDSSAEIKAKYGIRAIRPLADATMARIAKGTMRYVINSPKPFLVQVNHGARDGGRLHDAAAPMPTMTEARGEAVVTPAVVVGIDSESGEYRGHIAPFVSYGQQGGLNRNAAQPLHTIAASAKDTNAIVTPFVTKFRNGATGADMREPLATVTAHGSETHPGGYAPLGVVAPILVGCGGRAGQSPPRDVGAPLNVGTTKEDLCLAAPLLVRTAHGEADRTGKRRGQGQRSIEEPAPTVVGSNDSALVAPYLVPRYGERPGHAPRTRTLEEPTPSVVPTGNEGHLAAVHIARQFGASVGAAADDPVGTITAGGAGKAAVVAAFLAQHNYQEPGHDAREPVSTIVSKGSTQGLVTAHLLNLRGSDRRGGPLDVPAPTVSAGGNHAAAVAAFLTKYYGDGVPIQPATDPLHTVTAKPRHGVVTVSIEGEPYVIVDIGMRMLTPRERYNAQGFPPSYKIDIQIEVTDRSGRKRLKPLPLDAQGRMCGNSVSPPVACALARANVGATAAPVGISAAE